MRVIDEIREGFASTKNLGAREITLLPEAYSGYVIRTPDGYGVAVETDEKMEVSERFNSCKFRTCKLCIDGKAKNYLVLSSSFEEYRYEFASLCAEFVEPGEDGKNRNSLLHHPYEWWKKWKELIGNTSREQMVYNVIAEMMVLLRKIREDSTTQWAASRSGSHDIECADESCEVKSTIKRYGATVTISGQHQLEHEKRLWLYFCRLEESLEGVSINDMKEQLISEGYDPGKLEMELEKQGFERGANIRNKKYKILEKRKYEVDESFPKITRESFKGEKIPDSVIHIEYTVDLDGLEYTTW